jgi:N utilization substance protein A
MGADLSDAIKMLVQEKGISEELVMKTIEDFLLAAYKRKYGTVENAVVKFNDEMTDVMVYSKKKIVDDVIDPVLEIDIDDAVLMDENAEIGDELLLEVNPKEFDRISVQSAKQKAKQSLREIQKDTLYSEFKDKVGEIIIGYYQRERNGNIFVDLGRTEGILPKKYQSPREFYRPNDRIKAIIHEVVKGPQGLNIVLSRTHADFVKKVFEVEVPEIYDKTVEVFKIVREPGYRTKIAVYSHKDDVDPVGACVGLKGVRIQTVVRELEGEKIDILKYETDPRMFIKNALSPAEIQNVIILDEGKKMALAIVDETQLSLAIGKQGLNVRLANRLVDWNIDVKTVSQFEEMDISQESRKAVSALFADSDQESDEEITRIEELDDLPPRLVDILKENGIMMIESLVALTDADLKGFQGLSPTDIEIIQSVIRENVEIVEDGQQSAESQEDVEETYECPECGHEITAAMSVCPNCGVGLSFESFEEEGEE